MSATSQFPSNGSISSRTLPPTLTLGKRLHPPPNPRSRSARSTTLAASSVFRKSSRCGTSGPNLPDPQDYSHGPSFSSSWSLDCATPKIEGPSEPGRPKHTPINRPLSHIVPRFPSTNCFRSSLSSRRPWDDICTPITHPLRCCTTRMLHYRLIFWTNGDTQPLTHCMYQLSNHTRPQ